MRQYWKIWLVSALLLGSISAHAAQSCVQIYYNQFIEDGKTPYPEGRKAATILQNLLGHFPDVQQYIIPIERYRPGQLNRCEASFYIGLYPGYQVPETFIKDFVNAKHNVVWINNHISQLGKTNLQKLWHANYLGIAALDARKVDAEGKPGYYNQIHYKGVIFKNLGNTNATGSILGDIELRVMYLQNANDWAKEVIAYATHSTYGVRTPYILHNGNHWYVADNPFRYMRPDGQYSIFADTLFDILGKAPLHGDKHYAFVRIEDINPHTTDLKEFRSLVKALHGEKIPFSISVVPIFKDTLHYYKRSPAEPLAMTKNRKFIRALEYAEKKGGSIILHGVTHQYDFSPDVSESITTSGNEFWDGANNKPLKEDSPDFVLQRLEKGWSIVQNAKITPLAWMTPHYRASTLDNTMFSQLFLWMVGHVSYGGDSILQAKTLPESLTFDRAGVFPGSYEKRLHYFSDMKVKPLKGSTYSSQFFPYEIYGDTHGARIIPESLGYVAPQEKQTLEQIVDLAKKYKPLRDTWASFFIHSFVFDYSFFGKPEKDHIPVKELKKTIRELKKMGYEFVDLRDWVANHTLPKRPKPIEVNPLA